MPKNFRFLHSRPAQLLTGVLLLQACLIPLLAPAENTPLSRPLADIPHNLAGWRMFQESPIDAETMALLRADDTLSRICRSGRLGREFVHRLFQIATDRRRAAFAEGVPARH